MSVFETVGDTTQRAKDIGERYVKTSRQYFRLKIFRQLTSSLSTLIKVLLVGGLFVIGLLFFSVSGAIHLGEILENRALGYVIVGAIYFVLTLIAYLIKSSIDKKVISKMASKFFE